MANPTQSRAERAPAPPPEQLLASLLEPLRLGIDQVLDQMPDNRLEARRVITREWGLDPTPAELRAIVQVAHESAGQGSSRDTVRLALALRILVDRELRPLFDRGQIESADLAGITESIPLLLQAVEAIEDQLGALAETVDPDERDFLLQVGGALIPSRDSLTAAEVLAPRLELLASAESAEAIRLLVPSMNDEEFELLCATSAMGPEAGTTARESNPCSVCVAALVLRAVIEGDLAAWEETREADPQASIECLERNRTAHHAVSRRLQKQQTDAVLAGLTDYAETLRRIQGSLFSAYRKLTLALSEESDDAALHEPVEEETADLEQLLAESAAQDALADAEMHTRSSEDELCLDALKKTHEPKGRPNSVIKPYDRKQERLRIRILSSIAGVMLLVCASVYASRMRGYQDPLKVHLQGLSDTLALSDVTAVGPMMYAVVSHWSWDHLTDEKRLSSVRALGLSAQNEGYETVYLVDEANEQLATWTVDDGAQLVTVD